MDNNQKFVLSSSMLSFDERGGVPSWDKYAARKAALQQKWAGKLYGRKVEDIASELNLRYNDCLVKNGLCMSREELKSKNQIDIRKIVDINKENPSGLPRFGNSKERFEFLVKTKWLSAVPCLKEAVIRINTFRYIYFQILDIDMEGQSYKVHLHDYVYQSGSYVGGVFGTATMHFASERDGDTEALRAVSDPNDTEEVLFSKMYRLFTRHQLGWTDMEYDIWGSLIVQYADETESYLARNKTNQFHELAKVFIAVVTKINEQLYYHKASRPVKSDASTTTSTKKEYADVPEQKHKFTRMVGAMSIESEKVPKLPTERTVVLYKVAEWPTRGFIRTYKNGKTTYVRESTHHRRALQKEGDSALSQTIKFK